MASPISIKKGFAMVNKETPITGFAADSLPAFSCVRQEVTQTNGSSKNEKSLANFIM
jgi:hypothetical protein